MKIKLPLIYFWKWVELSTLSLTKFSWLLSSDKNERTLSSSLWQKSSPFSQLCKLLSEIFKEISLFGTTGATTGCGISVVNNVLFNFVILYKILITYSINCLAFRFSIAANFRSDLANATNLLCEYSINSFSAY